MMEVRRLQYSDDLLSKVLEIEREYVKDELLCIRSDKDDIVKCLSSGCSFGVFDKGQIVAFSLCYFSDYCTAYVDKCFVLPEYRGRGKQRALLSENVSSLASKGVDEIFAMVSPNNIASLKSFLSVGFMVQKTIHFNSVERLLLKLHI